MAHPFPIRCCTYNARILSDSSGEINVPNKDIAHRPPASLRGINNPLSMRVKGEGRSRCVDLFAGVKEQKGRGGGSEEGFGQRRQCRDGFAKPMFYKKKIGKQICSLITSTHELPGKT